MIAPLGSDEFATVPDNSMSTEPQSRSRAALGRSTDLRQYGCHGARGILLSRPISGDTVMLLLSARWIQTRLFADREVSSPGMV